MDSPRYSRRKFNIWKFLAELKEKRKHHVPWTLEQRLEYERKKAERNWSWEWKPPKVFIPYTDAKIVRTYMQLRANFKFEGQRIDAVAKELRIHPVRVLNVLKRSRLRWYAKQHVKKLEEEVYKDRIPMMKEIIGKGLMKVKEFVDNFTPSDMGEARILEKMVTDLNGMLRLDTGQSTQNIAVAGEVAHNMSFDIKELQKRLSQVDPVFSYPELDAPAVEVDVTPARDKVLEEKG
jgi:hypothetical protein